MPSVQASAVLSAADVVLDGRTVLRGIDLELGPGVTIVRGPNGAGKTTLLRAIAGLVPLARGTRVVSGDVLFLGHRPQLHRALSAEQNLSFYSRYRGIRAPDIAGALAVWGVAEATLPVDRLSAGQRRRTALARLDLECAPGWTAWPRPLVLLDEPFAELDEDAVALLARRVTDLSARSAVVIATHAHPELSADRTLRIDAGSLVA